MDNLLSGIIGAILGAFVSVILPHIFNVHFKRKEYALKLQEEYEGDVAYKHRCEGDKWLMAHQEGLMNEHYRKLPHEDLVHVSYVISFYLRLYFAAYFKQTDHKIMYLLFARNFLWWYVFLFEKKVIPSTWNTPDRDFNKIYEWFRSQAQRMGELEQFENCLSETRELYKERYHK